MKKQKHIQFKVNFYGFARKDAINIPPHINDALIQAETPKEVERTISEFETELAALFNPCDEFLTCDSAVELMANVLNFKGFLFIVVCGINDFGESHAYIQMGDRLDPTEEKLDPTYQGFGDNWEE
jgi:hypothetical protein